MHILESIVAGRIDIGVVYNPAPTPAVETLRLFDVQLHLISPGAKSAANEEIGPPVSLKTLPEYPLVIPSRPNAIRMFVETSLAAAGLKINVAWEIDGVPSILDLVDQRQGFAVLPLNALRAHQGSRRLIARPIVRPRLLKRSRPREFIPQRPLTALAQKTMDLLGETLRSHLSAMLK